MDNVGHLSNILSSFHRSLSLARVAPTLFLSLFLSPSPAPAQTPPPDPCAGGPLVSARVEGCEVSQCRDQGFLDGILDTADMKVGQATDSTRLAAGASRVQKLGFFREVSASCSQATGGVAATLRVVPVTRLRALVFKGNGHFYDSRLADRITLQARDPLDPQDTHTPEVLDRVRDTLKKLYLEHGFEGTEVESRIVPAAPFEVDLVLDITEGERPKIAAVSASLAWVRAGSGPPPGPVSCPSVRVHDLKNWSGVAAGDPYTEKTIPDTVRRLTRALRGIGFSGVRVHVQFDRATRRLDIQADYESCYLLRFFSREREAPGRLGYTVQTDTDLLDVLPFGDSGVFDATEAALGREEVQTWLENRGYLLADVVLDFRQFEHWTEPPEGSPDRPKTDDWEPSDPRVAGIISYYLTLNGHVEIRGIRFSGNRSLPDADLLKAMNTREYDFFGDTGAVLPDQIFSDLDRIARLYRDHGYPDVRFAWAREGAGRVRETTREGHDVVHAYSATGLAFRIRRPPLTTGVYLEIGIVEGDRSVLGEVSVDGVKAVSRREATETLGLKTGGPFSASGVREAVTKLTRTLSNDGYLGADAKVSCRGHDPDVPEDQCVIETVKSRRVDLVIRVTEGSRTSVGAIFVQGTRRTKNFTVLRDFPTPGAPFDAEKVAEAVRRLKDLGIFSSVQVSPVGAEEKPPRDRVALVVNCRESRSRFVDISGGLETLTRSGDVPGYISSPMSTSIAVQDRSTTAFGRALGLQIPDVLVSAEVRYTDMNFLGRGKRLYLPFKYGLSATAWDRYAAFTPTYVDPRFFARGLSFRVTPFAIYDRATTEKLDMIQLGAEFAVSKELVRRLYGAISYEVAEVKTRNPDTMTSYSPFRLENKLIPTLTYERLDHPINPMQGGLAQASLAYINAYVNGDLKNYLKVEVTGKLFLTARRTVTLAVMAKYGDSKSFQAGGKLPQEERFTLGGNRGVRGFSDDGISQYWSDGNLRLVRDASGKWSKPYGGDTALSGSVEVRFPVIRRINVFGCIFYDVGALAERMSELSLASFRSTVGFGVRYLLGDTIPFRLDYGLILDRRCKEIEPDTGLCRQKEEVGNIHFGILYTF